MISVCIFIAASRFLSPNPPAPAACCSCASLFSSCCAASERLCRATGSVVPCMTGAPPAPLIVVNSLRPASNPAVSSDSVVRLPNACLRLTWKSAWTLALSARILDASTVLSAASWILVLYASKLSLIVFISLACNSLAFLRDSMLFKNPGTS